MMKFFNDKQFDSKILNIENCFIFDKSNLVFDNQIVLNKDESKTIFIFDFSKHSQFNLHVLLHKNSSFNFYYAAIKDSDFEKNIKIKIDHLEEHSTSHVEMFGLNNSQKNSMRFDMIASIFNKATKSATRVEGKIVNLKEKCSSTVLPILNIEENDVKASHGAALGTIDQRMIYYLTSRGVEQEQAKKLVTASYFRKIVDLLTDEKIKKDVLKHLININ